MSRVPEEARGYSVPDTSDTPRRWADGPHKGKLVSSSPVKVRALKLDPVEAEARAEASRLAKLGRIGKLEIEAAHARKIAELKQSAYEVAYSYQENPWLRQEVVPPSRWPIYLLATVMALLAGLQFATYWRGRPTLAPESASSAPPHPEELVESGQGRAANKRGGR